TDDAVTATLHRLADTQRNQFGDRQRNAHLTQVVIILAGQHADREHLGSRRTTLASHSRAHDPRIAMYRDQAHTTLGRARDPLSHRFANVVHLRIEKYPLAVTNQP